MENWNQQVRKSFSKATKGNFHQLKNLKDNVWFINEVLIKRLRDESLLTTDGTFVWFQDLKIFNTVKNDFEKPLKQDKKIV